MRTIQRQRDTGQTAEEPEREPKSQTLLSEASLADRNLRGLRGSDGQMS
jgi:hypothetical protein